MPEPFTGIYSGALKDLCATIDPLDFVLFMYLCAHANGEGRCWPGVKKIGQALDWRFEEVRYRLDRLERHSLLRFRRRGERDVETGEFAPDIYQMNVRVLLTKSPVTHPAENAEPVPVTHPAENAEPVQFRIAPVQPSQPESEPESINQNHEPESITTTTTRRNSLDGGKANSHSQPSSAPSSAWQNEEGANPKYPVITNHITPAPAGTKPVPTGQVEDRRPPSSAPPPNPSDWRPEPRYINALPDAHLEALANELKALATPTRLYNARELVMHYGEAAVRAGLIQLTAAKGKGNVYNPMGLLTSWLRNGAVQAEPVESPGRAYTTGKYADFIES